MDVGVILGYLTGLRLLADNLPFSILLSTAAFIHLIDGIMCRLIARNNGYAKNLWAVLGFIFGVWALLFLFLVPRRK